MVKVLASPINPSDIAFMKGMYDKFDVMPIKYPTVSGWEGAGIVVENGGGMMGWKALGKKVAFIVEPNSKIGGCH